MVSVAPCCTWSSTELGGTWCPSFLAKGRQEIAGCFTVHFENNWEVGFSGSSVTLGLTYFVSGAYPVAPKDLWGPAPSKKTLDHSSDFLALFKVVFDTLFLECIKGKVQAVLLIGGFGMGVCKTWLNLWINYFLVKLVILYLDLPSFAKPSNFFYAPCLTAVRNGALGILLSKNAKLYVTNCCR